MDRSRLMNRTDQKFLFSPEMIPNILTALLEDYRILSIDSNQLFTYYSYYFDTPEKEFYRLHHAGKKNRHKIRFRTYNETGITFLEIKYKNNKGRTIKTRVEVEDWERELGQESKRFIEDISGIQNELHFVLMNKFNRITLVNKHEPERVTFDFNLSFEHQGTEKEFGHIAIAEVKQSRLSRFTPVMRKLKGLQIYPQSISKYCLGIYSCYPGIKYNRFKENFTKLKKLESRETA